MKRTMEEYSDGSSVETLEDGTMVVGEGKLVTAATGGAAAGGGVL